MSLIAASIKHTSLQLRVPLGLRTAAAEVFLPAGGLLRILLLLPPFGLKLLEAAVLHFEDFLGLVYLLGLSFGDGVEGGFEFGQLFGLLAHLGLLLLADRGSVLTPSGRTMKGTISETDHSDSSCLMVGASDEGGFRRCAKTS